MTRHPIHLELIDEPPLLIIFELDDDGRGEATLLLWASVGGGRTVAVWPVAAGSLEGEATAYYAG